MGAVVVERGARLSEIRGDAVVVVDQAEYQRRRRAGLGAVTQLGILDALTSLPHGRSVPVEDLPPWNRPRLDQVSAAILARTAAGVRREIRPAAAVTGVQVRIGSWTTRLRAAAEFARFAPTVIVLHQDPNAEQYLQASFYGVGLTGPDDQTGHVPRIYLPPVQPAPSCSAVHWLFREHAYDAWLHSLALARTRKTLSENHLSGREPR